MQTGQAEGPSLESGTIHAGTPAVCRESVHRACDLFCSALFRVERLLARVRRRVKAHSFRTAQRSYGGAQDSLRRLSPVEWERAYLGPCVPVAELGSIVARQLAEIGHGDEALLEAGCGSAGISAELALAGYNVILCDYSLAILRRAKVLFQISGLPEPPTVLCDISRGLPLADDAVDIVWSSGVLEHWSDEELILIVSEMRRVARRLVVSFVPSDRCVLYRFAKYVMETSGRWRYGREEPRSSLKDVFESAGLTRIQERILDFRASLDFASHLDPGLGTIAREWAETLTGDDPVVREQGYLLMTVGHKD